MEKRYGLEEMKCAILFLVLISCSAPPFIHFDNATFVVELARTPEEKQRGLMFREILHPEKGMLFFFDDVAPRNFWMKNTLIPLDMIFIDDSWKVVEVKANIPPCKEDPCPVYTSLPAKYVLEINAGLAEKYGISVNSTAWLRE